MKVKIKSFTDLTAWKKAHSFVLKIYRISKLFPIEELYGLTNQIRRAAVSIALNIAEGSTKGSDADFRRFLKMAQGSINEVVTGFYISLDQRFISQKAFDQVYDFSLKLNARLNALIKSLSR